MPAVEPGGARVLVTGANGYLGMWVVHTLLEQDYFVRAVVRSAGKGDRLKAHFTSYSDKIEIFVVEDVAKDGAFDDAVRGVDAIEHTASPATLKSDEPDDYIKPAIQGTVGVLESARKFGDKIKRVVITSSVVAVHGAVAQPNTVFDEEQWGEEAIRDVREYGKDATSLAKYSASKTLAEKAAWEFYKQHKDQLRWDLVVLHPSFIFGVGLVLDHEKTMFFTHTKAMKPSLQEVKRPEDLNESLVILWNMITRDQPDDILRRTFSFIHVQDISAAHVAALRKEEAGGERIIVASDSSTWQATRNLIYALQPELYKISILRRGNPALDNTIQFRYNPDKGRQILGLEYASAEKVFNDTVKFFKQKGWLAGPVEA